MNRIQTTTLAAALLLTATVAAQPPRNVMTIDAGAKGIAVQPTMYGLFFEDINFAADGGLYAEKIKNRSFEFDQPLMGWKTFGNVTLRDDGPFERNPHYVRLGYAGHPVRFTGLENEGFFGIGVEAGKRYRFSVWARTAGEADREYISIHLCDDDTADDDQMFAHAVLEIDSKEWKRYETMLESTVTNPKASLRIFLETGETIDPGQAVDLEHVSLFPAETFRGHENGLRADIAQTLADLEPGVFRFPGGCIVEGTDLANRYQWKNSVGPVENRPININRWNYTFPYRLFPDYYQSYGLGFYEYFLFAEEIGAEPLPVISCGMACQFQNDPAWDPHACMEELDEYVQDALDLIEFANGATTTRWGALRAEMGHPEPFGLKYLAVGNEQWGTEYVERLEPFVKAIRERYPDIRIVGSSGPYLGGEWFAHLWPEMRRLGADLVDEHYYSWEGFFERNADRYDDYPREGTKVFAGEYACHGSDGKKFNHFNAALLEAAFMTGLERNADVVEMATYAPLLAHAEGWQWRPDLVWFDNLRVMRSCSYHVQRLYATNKGTHVLPLTMDGRPVAGKEGQHELYATAAKDTGKGEYIVKVVNLSEYSQPLTLYFKNLPRKQKLTNATCTTLHSDNPVAENTLDAPDTIVPQTKAVETEGNTLTTRIGPRTFAVYRFKY
ncbi:MAG: carbohydrate binding domain-containing protein [Alistipes sp.]|nr:carbohydrate binding domain-containing protein [Alistipes sp.]